MDAINPQRQIAIVGADGGGRAPLQLDAMAGVANGKPTCAPGGLAVVVLSEPKLIGAGAKTQFDIEHQFRCGRDRVITGEQVMGITLGHANAVRGKVKPRPIAYFGVGAFIDHIN